MNSSHALENMVVVLENIFLLWEEESQGMGSLEMEQNILVLGIKAAKLIFHASSQISCLHQPSQETLLI